MVWRESFLVAATFLCLLLSACGGLTPHGPDATTQTSPSTPVDARFGAPRVDRALQLGTRAQTPCTSLLTTTDLNAFGLSPVTGRQRAYAQAVSCVWVSGNENNGASLTITTTPNRNKFVDAYRARVLPIFTPIVVSGQPAVVETSEPADFMCVATVAVNDNEGIAATWYAQQPVDPPTEACDNATKALAAVIAHLPPR